MSMLLAGGASTQSRGRRPLPPGAVRGTTLATRGIREIVRFDFEDGHHEQRELLSWLGGQAGLLFGASSPDITDLTYLRETHGSYGHAAEYELAGVLGEVFDGYLTSSDMACRFFQSGGEACAAAVRIARAATGRDVIATFGYHGAGQEFVHPPLNKGYAAASTALHNRFEFGDRDDMIQKVRGSSLIMVEVPALDDEQAIASFLMSCRLTADDLGIPFVVDDVVCGFRLALAGSCERYGVKADMVILGKAMSVTGCVSAVIGCADLVNRLGEDVFYSTTFGGSPGPCSVAAATVRWLLNHHAEVYGAAGHLQTIGRALKDGLNERGVKCIGQPERSIVVFDTDEQWLAWCSKMIEQGVIIHRPNFPTMVHTLDDVEQTLRAVEAIR